jgi:hypothetical protein
LTIGFAVGFAAEPVDASKLAGLHWRSVGPAMFAGRVDDVAGVPGNPNILYVAGSTAGLFRSTNAGATFTSVFNDGNTLSVGAVALAPDNPNIVYIGTGEGFPRNSTSVGDGVYKTNRWWPHVEAHGAQRHGALLEDYRQPEGFARGVCGSDGPRVGSQ